MTHTNSSERLDSRSLSRANRDGLWTRIARAQIEVVARFLTLVAVATFSMALSSRATPQTAIASNGLSRSFDLSYVVRVTPSPGTRNVRVWVPLPSSDELQTISQVRIDAPVKVKMRKEARYGDRYAYLVINSAHSASPFEIRLTFHVVRFERRLDLASPMEAPSAFPKDVAVFLQPDKLVPTGGLIADAAREQTQGLASPIQKARSIYEYVISAMRYDYKRDGAGRGDALWALRSQRGNCVDFHSLFIAMARAAGIPARFEIGFLLPAGQVAGIVPGYHSWAEFYVNGIGWIPVDALQAAQDLGKRDDFFGAIDAHRVMISMGRDVAVLPAPEAGPLNYIVYPYVEMDGKLSANYSMDFFFNEARFNSATPSVVRKAIVAGSQWMTTGRSPRFPS
jgi:transglutaminase-like putative cysteine protease